MAEMPAYAAFSAATELALTAAVLYAVWRGWRGDPRRWLLAGVLLFEVAFNVSYMAYRMLWDTDGLEDIPAWLGAVAAGHGILSLLMLLATGFAVAMAWRDRETGENFFRSSPAFTWGFVGLWLLAVASGELVFAVMYLA